MDVGRTSRIQNGGMRQVKGKSTERCAVRGMHLVVCGFSALLLLCGCAAPRSNVQINGGPIINSGVTVDGTQRLRAVGPFWEQRIDSDAGRNFAALRPLYSRMEDVPEARSGWEVLWPVAAGKQVRNQTQWRVVTAQKNDFNYDDPDGRYRFMILPFWVSGRSVDGDSYAGLFPLYGHLREFLWQDEIRFVLFPLYANHRVKENRSHHILWPFISWTRGPDVWRRRVFPLYGESRRTDQWQRRFILWPVWTSLRMEQQPEYGGFVLFPLFGYMALPERQAWMLFPPFIRWSRAEDGFSAALPWPFVRLDRGEQLRRTDIWPLWGRKSEAGLTRGFFLWPIGHWQETCRASETVRMKMLLPLWVSRTVTPTEEDAADDGEKFWKLWPLISRRSSADSARVCIPSLWPGPDLAPVERNYAPLWSLYVYRRGEESREHDFLWGLFRSRHEQERLARFSLFPLFRYESHADKHSHWSVLGGLLAHEQESLQSRWRLLYVWLSGRNEVSEKGAEH